MQVRSEQQDESRRDGKSNQTERASRAKTNEHEILQSDESYILSPSHVGIYRMYSTVDILHIGVLKSVVHPHEQQTRKGPNQSLLVLLEKRLNLFSSFR